MTPVSAVLLAGFLLWTGIEQDAGGTKVSAQILAVGSVVLAATVPLLLRRSVRTGSASGRRDGWTFGDGWVFALSAGAIALLFASLLVELYPNALPSTTSAANDLTLIAASSSHYTLTAMTVVAVICLPLVLAYQAWTYGCSVTVSSAGASSKDPRRSMRSRASPGSAPSPGAPRAAQRVPPPPAPMDTARRDHGSPEPPA